MRFAVLPLLLASSAALAAPNPVSGPILLEPEWQQVTRDMIKEAVEIPTVAGRGEMERMANALATRFRAAGWADEDIRILPYKGHADEDTVALMVRYPAAGTATAKPILILGHMDVVEADRADWERDPFSFIEEDGYFYGRGVNDDKQGVISASAALMKLKDEGFAPNRDIILFFTGDEETRQNGARLGASEWKELLDAEFALNADAGGGGYLSDGTPLGFGLQTAEKIYQDFTWTTTNPGGHSSRPRPDNAIYELSAALNRLSHHRFEPALTETTRAYFQARQEQEEGALGDAMRAWLADENDGAAADAIEAWPIEVGTTRTRCVATLLGGGHAPNALPQKATANVNCRAMPGTAQAALQAELQAIAGDKVTIEPVQEFRPSPASPLRDDVVNAYTSSIRSLYGDVPIIPHMSTGATDGLYFRAAGIPVYGAEASWGISPDDERAHGLNERIPIRSLYNNVVHWESMLRALAGGK